MQAESLSPMIAEVVFKQKNMQPILVPIPRETGSKLVCNVGRLKLAIMYYIQQYQITGSKNTGGWDGHLFDPIKAVEWVICEEIETFRLIPIANHNKYLIQYQNFYYFLKQTISQRILLDYMDVQIPIVKGNHLSTSVNLVGDMLYLNFNPNLPY